MKKKIEHFALIRIKDILFSFCIHQTHEIIDYQCTQSKKISGCFLNTWNIYWYIHSLWLRETRENAIFLFYQCSAAQSKSEICMIKREISQYITIHSLAKFVQNLASEQTTIHKYRPLLLILLQHAAIGSLLEDILTLIFSEHVWINMITFSTFIHIDTEYW